MEPEKDALIQRRPRKAFQSLVAKGWTDSIREVFGDERVYTFWTYWRNRYERNHGLPLDHLLLSKPLSSRLVQGGVDTEIRAEDGASDHAPAWIKLAWNRGGVRPQGLGQRSGTVLPRQIRGSRWQTTDDCGYLYPTCFIFRREHLRAGSISDRRNSSQRCDLDEPPK